MARSGPVNKIAVAGATGHIGTLTVNLLRSAGHQVVEISRSGGIDLRSVAGLVDVLTGVHAVVDCTNTSTQVADEAVGFFGTVTANLLAAEERIGVSHHVALSIVGLAEPARNAHYAGKLAQEAAVVAGPRQERAAHPCLGRAIRRQDGRWRTATRAGRSNHEDHI